MYKFKVTREVIVDSFPHFRKYYQFYYKVLNETHEIGVTYIPDGELQSARVEYDKIVPLNTFREGSEEITEEEFRDVYFKATQIILEKNN
jgi:hypothetical protein